MGSFINDGYQFRARIDAVDMVHDGLEFVYRPMSPRDLAKFHSDCEGKNPIEAVRVHARWLKDRIVSWKNLDGSPCPELTEDILVGVAGKQRINTLLRNRLVNIVLWGDAPDSGEKYEAETEVKN